MTSSEERVNLLLEDLAVRATKHRGLIRELETMIDDHPDIAHQLRILIAEYA
jgi:hypothetical protein